MNRAYSFLTVTKADDEARVIEGIASTPTVDKVGDVVEPLGAQFKLPMPFLWQHKHDQPIGHVEYAKATPTGIPFRARLVKISEPGKLRDRLEEAWQSLKSGLVSAVSIGFRPLDFEPLPSGGLRFKKWAWDELSAVTIPAGIGCDIQTVKRYDRAALAAASPCRVVRLSGGPVGGRKHSPVVRLDSPLQSATSRPIAAAITAQMEKSQASIEEAARRKELGGANAMLLDALAAGTRATDAELAELRARIAKLERGG